MPRPTGWRNRRCGGSRNSFPGVAPEQLLKDRGAPGGLELSASIPIGEGDALLARYFRVYIFLTVRTQRGRLKPQHLHICDIYVTSLR
jgi:hypothetical protein